MLVHNKKSFIKGNILLLSFFVVLYAMFHPVLTDEMGNKVNALHYSDELFNSLAKGSAYYIPDVAKKAAGLEGNAVDVTVKQTDAAAATAAAKLVNHAGLTAEVKDNTVHVTGDMGKMLGMVVTASDKLYHNDDKAVAEMIGASDGVKGMKTWWGLLNPMVKELQKQKKIEEAEVVTLVNGKAIEPAYNFFGIRGERVADRAAVVTGLLVFYVLYTMWYGYAIFDIFDGIGLSMSKSKAKKEA